MTYILPPLPAANIVSTPKYKKNNSFKPGINNKLSVVLFLAFLSASFLPLTVEGQSWYNSGWLYRKAITIDYTKVGAGPHTNFPVLISRADSDLQTRALSTGNDILFTASDGTTKLSHEIESYTSASGTLAAWVEIPSLSSAANTVIYMYYGNAAAANQQDVTGTWDASFKGVYHLNGVFTDATSNAYNGTNTGTVAATGKISNGRGYVRSDGADKITITGLTGWPGNATISGWGTLNSRDATGAHLVSLGDYLAINVDDINDGLLGSYYVSGAWGLTKSSPKLNPAGSGWHYFVYTFNDVGNAQSLYMDGILRGSEVNASSITYSGLGANTIIGGHAAGNVNYDFDGTIDEVRVASSVRSAGWILTEYNNQNSPGTFYSVGSQATSAKTFTGTGNFSEAARWSGGTLPVAGDDLIIDGVCTVDNNASTNTIAYGSLTIGTATGRTLGWAVGGTNRLNVLNVSAGTAASSLNMTNGGVLSVRGTWTSTNLTFTSGAGTVEIQSSITLPAAYATFNNLTINGAGITVTQGVATTVGGNLTISSGTFSSNSLSTTVSGNWINNGTFTAGAGTVIFAGATSNTVTGSSTTAFNKITVDKGTNVSSIIDVQSLITITAGGLSLIDGTFKLSSNSTITAFTADITVAPYLIPATSGLWVNGGTVNSATDVSCVGMVRVSSGTLNVGDAAEERFLAGNGSTIIVDGGAFNIAARFTRRNAGDVISLTISAGTLTVAGIGSTHTTFAPFIFDEPASSFTMSGGTIVIRREGGSGASDLGYVNLANNYNVTGGTLQIGDASTPVSQTMLINSTVPIWNLTVSATNGPTATLLTNAFTVKNDLTISGGTLNASNLDLTVAGKWANSGTFTAGTGTVNFNGTTTMSGTTLTNTFNNLTVTASSTVTSSTGLTTLVVNGALTTGASALLDLGTTTALSGTLSSVSNSGTIKTSVPTTTSATPIPAGKTWGGTVDYYHASANQTIVGGTYDNLTVRPGSGRTASASGNVVVNGALYVTTAFGAFDLSTNILSGTLTSINNQGDIRTSVPTTTSATPIPAGKTWNGTIYYNATTGAQTVVGGTYNFIRFTNTSGTNTAAGDLTVNSQFVTAAGGTLDMGSAYRIINMGSTITNNGTVKTSVLTTTSSTPFPAGRTWGGTGTVEYASATGAQTVASGTFNNLKLSNTSGSDILTGNVIINGIFTLSGGTVTTTSSYAISLNSGASFSRTSGGHVIGNLKKSVATGATSVTFEIGDASNYTPATVAFASVTTAQYLTATVTATDHPNSAGSGIRIDKSVNRYWTFTNAGIVFTTATLTMNWVAGDVDAGSTTSNFVAGNYSASAWTLPTTASPLATSIDATGITSLGDFAVGQSCTSSSWTFSYTASPYCSNGGFAAPTITGSAGTFTSAAGLSINASTGVIDLAASIAGVYTVTNTSLGGCSSSATATITITAVSSATISYAGSPYCSTSGTATVTQTGTAGGNYSSTAELSYTPSTGAVNLAASIAGTYTVTYTVAASGGCASFSTSTSIQVSPISNNSLNFVNGLNGVICATPTETGTATLTAPVGSIFTSVDFASYGTPNGTCSYFTKGSCHSLTSLSVSEGYLLGNNSGSIPATNAVFGDACSGTTKRLYVQATYTQPICSGTTPGIISGTVPTGGSGSYTYLWEKSTTSLSSGFAAAPGTNNTKDYNPGVLTQTTWFRRTVYSNGCSDTKVICVTVTPLPSATISYTGTPYCSSSGTASVSLTGTSGGTFTAAAGLSINSGTGAVNLSASTAGTYTVTYTIAASGGCSAYTTTTSITVTTQPYATGYYIGNPYCTNAGVAYPTGSSQGASGILSSTGGLPINSSTGVVNLGASTPGTYTITYSVPASGGCSLYTTTYELIIQASPSASISYSGSPYCSGAGTANVTRSGTAGGAYSSTAGLIIDAGTGTVNLATSTPGTYTVSYKIAAASSCAAVTTTTTITINAVGRWTGSLSTDWTNAANWGCNILPSATTDVIIPATSNAPVISSGTIAVKNLTISTGASITVGSTLQIAGVVSNSGGISASNGTIEMNGSSAQVIPAGLFTSSTLKNLVISNAAGVSLAGTLRVTDVVSFGNVNNSVLTTGGFLTLVSSSSITGQLADITNNGSNSGNSISGTVIVERYIQSRRSYRFLTAAVNSVAGIKANWMENTNNATISVNNNPVPGYGTHITGSGGNTNGFDATVTNNASLFTFNNQTQAWVAVNATSGLVNAGTPYRIMIRGNRSTNLSDNYAASSVTTLRTTGIPVTGTVVMAKPGGGGTAGMPELSGSVTGYSFIANPYAAVVDWGQTVKHDVASTIYYYDPTISGSNGRGAYVTYNDVQGGISNPSSNVDNNIQPGQAFFVQTTGPAPSLTFHERHKTSTRKAVFRPVSELAHLTVKLLLQRQVNTNESADGFAAYFSEDYDSTIGNEDSYKFTNLDENIGILRNGTMLSIEGRKPVKSTDTLPIKIWQLTQSSYSLKIKVSNFANNITAFLQDAYLKTNTVLGNNAETSVPFSIDPDPASVASDRFRIVFEAYATLPVQLTGVKAAEKNKGVEVEWTAESESNMEAYEVERSGVAHDFITVGKVKAKGNTGTASGYTWFDSSPLNGDNYYRIKTIDKSGEIKFSEVVRVQITSVANATLITASPTSSNSIKVNFVSAERGNYQMTLINNAGQILYKGSITHLGGSANKEITINNNMAAGIYQLQIVNEDVRQNIKILIR